MGMPTPMGPMPQGYMGGDRAYIRWIANEPIKPSGYVANKSQYYRTDPMSGQVVLIPKRSVWVRTRRRNSLNAKALDKAIARVESAKRKTRDMGRITVRDKQAWKLTLAKRKKC